MTSGNTLISLRCIFVVFCFVVFVFNQTGSGLCCHRIVMLLCRLAGINDLYAKIVGPTTPLNVVRATLKAFTSQVCS